MNRARSNDNAMRQIVGHGVPSEQQSSKAAMHHRSQASRVGFQSLGEPRGQDGGRFRQRVSSCGQSRGMTRCRRTVRRSLDLISDGERFGRSTPACQDGRHYHLHSSRPFACRQPHSRLAATAIPNWNELVCFPRRSFPKQPYSLRPSPVAYVGAA